MARLTSFVFPCKFRFLLFWFFGGVGCVVGCKLRWIRTMCTAYEEYHHVAGTVQAECLFAIFSIRSYNPRLSLHIPNLTRTHDRHLKPTYSDSNSKGLEVIGISKAVAEAIMINGPQTWDKDV